LIERDHFEDPGADGRVLSKRIFKKWVGDCCGLGKRQVAGSCKCDNEPPVSTKYEDLLA
jgi:hypothetical protein